MRDLIPYLKLYRKHWFGLTLGMILGLLTLLSAISLLTLSGWFIAASAVAGLSIITRQTFNYMLPGAGVRGFSMSRTAGRWGERVVSHNATFKLLADLRLFFFRKLTPLIPGRHANLRDADLLNRLVADVDAMDHIYLRLVSPLVIGILGITIVTGFLAWFDPTIGFTLGGILLALMIILPIVFYRLGKRNGETLTHAKANYRITLLDWIQGHAELLLFNAEERYRQQAEAEQDKLLDAQRKMASLTGIANGLLMAATGWTLVLIMWIAANGIAGNAPDPFVAMVAFTTMASFEMMMPVAGAFQYLGQTLSSAKRLNEIIEATPDTVFDPKGYSAIAKGDIRLNDISYTYYGSDKPVVKHLSLDIKQGEKLALLGRTGCGKSTLLQLLTRSWDPQQGQILLDGVELTRWSEPALRNAITVVSQRVDVFNGSLRENLVLAKPDATDEQFVAALHKVGLNSLLDDKGLDTWLGDGGRHISGGERRRIGIARALLHDAPILLLDEPTEGLDRRTEQQILTLLLEFAKDKTVVFITHRLVGLDSMDQICLMDEGEIIEHGQHQQLLAQNGRYAELCRRI
ncbi:cysteine/glutathione ABC transporter ATP-binding protein/permease CydC [Photobacterium phosphoreum]|uniref:Glutathione/L-cysteine transport system ATP-binding/permease protein CydC n=1 Tax=Photobacterium phosphoreum TaxID=659 RepID=A0A2T3JUN4_PHOPO|nr:cysteine/glutathione ABC transporter ATP-binding protein/permease CydC [Photobacterium phosphoreum]MCD9520177.1 cysteine/glutathione ABC transporter ATP-binding protein/permease CydC [Photobacterium phosphoreum]PSU26170.1 cysteine/glutathione ABC transporter ATP-binding protein/permease CydC [Photobacterium phosphoreum]PSU44107.1 cysteine/glutathione ABC transporter ATP-binding protein/permease CydC [Photobacterium phosphoreum]PSU52947.1 cysteine/glutathione ABC transporter ATP-binding prote